MTKDEALKIVGQVCADFNGKLKDHQIIQQALQLIKDALEPKPEPKTEVAETKLEGTKKGV